MQTAILAATAVTGTAHYPATRQEPAQPDPQKAHYGSYWSRNDFLRVPLRNIYAQCVTYYNNKNLISRSNYEYLRDSYFNYARLLDKKPAHNPGNNYGEGIAHLYNEMCSLVEPELNVNIELSGTDKLSFVLWHTHNWECTNLYWLPIRFIEHLHPKFRQLVITFLHELKISNQLSDISSCDEAEYIFDWMKETIGESMYEWEKQNLEENILSYESGRAHKLLQRIEQRFYYKNLPRALDCYSAKNQTEQVLVDIMRDGLQFIGDDKPAIMDYDYDSKYQEYPDCRPIPLALQVGLIYTSNDTFADNMIGYIENIWQESYAIEPTSVWYISPTTEQLCIPDDYPERFFRWVNRFIDFIRRNNE